MARLHRGLASFRGVPAGEIARGLPGLPHPELAEHVSPSATTPLRCSRAGSGSACARAGYGRSHWEAAIAVECGRNGIIRLTPIGPRVELFEGRYVLPRSLREELLALATALAHPPRQPRPPYAADLPSE